MLQIENKEFETFDKFMSFCKQATSHSDLLKNEATNWSFLYATKNKKNVENLQLYF